MFRRYQKIDINSKYFDEVGSFLPNGDSTVYCIHSLNDPSLDYFPTAIKLSHTIDFDTVNFSIIVYKYKSLAR